MDTYFMRLDKLRVMEPAYFQRVVAPTPEEPNNYNVEAFLKKTPVPIVMEACKKVHQAEPTWNTTEEKMLANGRMEFKIVCTMLSQTGTGTGCTKKQAKHQAALDFLHRVVDAGRHHEFLIPGDTKEEAHEIISKLIDPTEVSAQVVLMPSKDVPVDNVTRASSIPEDKAKENWIGRVQELCQKKTIDGPVYETTEDGKPPNVFFTTNCKVRHLTTEGTSRTKKLSRTISAWLMFDLIQQGNAFSEDAILAREEEELANENNERAAEMEDVEKFQLAQDFVASLHDMLKDATKFNSFSLQFKDFPDKSTMNEIQCTLQVDVAVASQHVAADAVGGTKEEKRDDEREKDKRKRELDTDLPLHFTGAGDSVEAAHQDAARNAIIHFSTY